MATKLLYFQAPFMNSSYDFLIKFVSKTYDVNNKIICDEEVANVLGTTKRFTALRINGSNKYVIIYSNVDKFGLEKCCLIFVEVEIQAMNLSCFTEELFDKEVRNFVKQIQWSL